MLTVLQKCYMAVLQEATNFSHHERGRQPLPSSSYCSFIYCLSDHHEKIILVLGIVNDIKR